MRVGIFGGSFDPVHYGHLLTVETAREEMRLDQVVFLPLGVPPHCKNLRTSGEDRFQMLVRAISSYSDFTISRLELDSVETSYTARTLQRIRMERPKDELFFIVSSETFNDMPNWYRPEQVCCLASLVIARRAGYSSPNFSAFDGIVAPERLEVFKNQVVDSPLIGLSSTMIRKRIAQGRSVRFMTPDSVIEYIDAHNLYRI